MRLPRKTENGRYSKLKTKIPGTLRAAAQILKPFGVKGELKIFSYSRGIDEYGNITNLLRGRNDQHVVPCEIESVKSRGDEVFIKLKGVDDRAKAEVIVGEYLFVEEQQRKQLPEGKFFDDDLLDCSVVTEQGKQLGVVHDVVRYPAQKVYEVKTQQGIVLVPAVGEIVLSVDLARRTIVVRPPEGLFDGVMLE